MTEIEQRRRALAARLGELKVDALLVCSPANIRYLSDYAGSNGLMLVTPSETHFFTDPRYEIEVSQSISCKLHIAKGPLMLAAVAVIKRKKLKKIGFEAAWLRYNEAAKLKDLLPLGAALQPIGPDSGHSCG